MDTPLNGGLELVVIFSAACYAMLLACVFKWWRPNLLASKISDSAPPDLLTVVIAARNEAGNIGPCLQSLLGQAAVTQIIVVDDHSTDATASVVDSWRARDQRIVLLPAPDLPADWLGKSHALHFGAHQVSTPYILFTDADVIFGQGIMGAALRKMTVERLDHLGGHFFVDCRSVAEEICAPVMVLSSGLALFGTAKSLGAATGAFNLVRTATYQTGGGHAPIKREIVDDVALARHLKSGGAKTEFVVMDDCLKVRLFVGFRGFVSSVTRSAVPFLAMGSFTVCLLTALGMALAMLPIVLLFLGIVAGWLAPAHLSAGSTAVLTPLPYLFGLMAIRFGRCLHNGRLLFQLCYPAALFALAASVFYAALAQLCRRPVTWRGRVYANNRMLQSTSRERPHS